MKYWMPGLVALMAVPTAQAMNYRLVYSPSQKLEVFIDDVKNSNPESWCGKSIPLRIVSAQSQDPAVLNDFLPRVGNLLEKQCPKAGHLPWTLTDKRGEKLASGEAAKVHG
ncbi:type VI secretion system-associated protein, partial [Serratia marcescens]|nr:type VI secretion system-associated protein [Serratia marcescens]